MGLAQDLLQQAAHLATYKGSDPSQASLRRAVSAACYALFHLLIEDASPRWQGSPEARTGLERAFDHGPMKNISMQFRKPSWQDWHGNPQPVPPALQRVASVFVDLQEERHTADYETTNSGARPRYKRLCIRSFRLSRVGVDPRRSDGRELPAGDVAQETLRGLCMAVN